VSSPSGIDAIRDRLGSISAVESLRPYDNRLKVTPEDTDQVAAILGFANAERIVVEPCGAGTKRPKTVANTPILHLSTERMNTVCEHTWQDLTCTVQAGCTWQTLQDTLARHGQFVALDPLFAERATVGGIIATNDSGSLRLKYGSLRDLVIGMTIVLADGTIAKSGGKVVKNVAGYDLHKLMIGAEGTLGVVTEVTFRLHAIPRHTRSFSFRSQSIEPLGDLLLQLLDSHLGIQAMQLHSARSEALLDVQLAALPEVIASQTDNLRTLAERANLPMADADEGVWRKRESFYALEDEKMSKVTMLPSQIAPLSRVLREVGGVAITQATGIMVACLPYNDLKRKEVLAFRTCVEEAGGSLTPVANCALRFEVPGKLPDSIDLMRRIKHQFDPNNILNPGRAIGGI